MAFDQTGFEDFWRIAQSFADSFYRARGLKMQEKQMEHERQMSREQLGIQREQLQISKQSMREQLKQAEEAKRQADRQYDMAKEQWDKTKEQMDKAEERTETEDERNTVRWENEQATNEIKANLDRLALKQAETDLKYRDRYWEAQIANLYEKGSDTAAVRQQDQLQSDFRAAWRPLLMNILGAKTYDQLIEMAPLAGMDISGLSENAFNFYRENNRSVLDNYLKTMAVLGLAAQYPGLDQAFYRSFADPWTVTLPSIPESAGKPRRFSLGGRGGTVGQAVEAGLQTTFGKPQILQRPSELMGQPLQPKQPITLETSARGTGLEVEAPQINKEIIINGRPYTAIIHGTQPLRVFGPQGTKVNPGTPEYIQVFDQLFPGMK
jgi:hypothetical protein